MKLNQILTQANQFERSKFINCLDKICSAAKESDSELAMKMTAIDGQLKQASEDQVTQLFLAGLGIAGAAGIGLGKLAPGLAAFLDGLALYANGETVYLTDARDDVLEFVLWR